MAKCLYCHTEEVDQKKWSRPCVKCLKLQSSKSKVNVEIGKRLPSAVIVDDNGNKVFVDKFGVEVEEHDYDLDSDPRGWKTAGLISDENEII